MDVTKEKLQRIELQAAKRDGHGQGHSSGVVAKLKLLEKGARGGERLIILPRIQSKPVLNYGLQRIGRPSYSPEISGPQVGQRRVVGGAGRGCDWLDARRAPELVDRRV